VKKIIICFLFIFLLGLHFQGKSLDVVKDKNIKPISRNYRYLSFMMITKNSSPSIPIKQKEIQHEIHVIAPNNDELVNPD
jgi:hypothetical protein